MRTNCTISQVTLTAAGLVLPIALYHGLRNELILSSDYYLCCNTFRVSQRNSIIMLRVKWLWKA